MNRFSHIVSMVLLPLLAAAAWPLEAAESARLIEQVKGNVYRFVDDRHRSVFMVTEDGIVVTDPLNRAAAQWLKAELERRFEVPVRYVIYSHNHSDHVYGGEVFQAPGVRFVSHKLARQDIEQTRARAVLPDLTFDDQLTLNLGDQQVELRYHGPNDGRGSISMLFGPDRVLFVVDWIVLGRMPWQKLWSYDIQGMINSTREVLNLDFDLLVGGHGDVGDKNQVRGYLNYLEALYAAVIDGIHRGRTLDQLKAEIRLDAFQELDFYEQWLPLNIEGVYERLMEESGMGWRPDLNR